MLTPYPRDPDLHSYDPTLYIESCFLLFGTRFSSLSVEAAPSIDGWRRTPLGTGRRIFFPARPDHGMNPGSPR